MLQQSGPKPSVTTTIYNNWQNFARNRLVLPGPHCRGIKDGAISLSKSDSTFGNGFACHASMIFVLEVVMMYSFVGGQQGHNLSGSQERRSRIFLLCATSRRVRRLLLNRRFTRLAKIYVESHR